MLVLMPSMTNSSDVLVVDVRIDADAQPARLVQARDPPRRRRERDGILGVDAHLDGVAARAHVGRQLQRLAGGQAHLLAHQVDAEHLLGHRVLDLDAGVHLHEVEVLVLVEQELVGADRLVTDALGRLAGDAE